MRGAALSDIHLGFRQFPAMTEGRNAREVDVERAWFAAVDNVVKAKPDLITIAGDVFQNPRPSMHAVRAWCRGLQILSDKTEAWTLVIPGNHDVGRTADSLSPALVPENLISGLRVVPKPERVQLHIARTDEDMAVACFPYVAGVEETYRVAPDAHADVNLLLMHAAVKGDAGGDELPHFYGGLGALDVGREADRWDAIICGDFHTFRRLHPTRSVFYSGSIERTSSDIWKEANDFKGIVLYDTDLPGELELVKHRTRSVDTVGLGDFFDDPGPVNAETVNYCLTEMAERGACADVIRLLVSEFPREERGDIDWKLVRKLKSSLLHFQLDLRWADRHPAHPSHLGAQGNQPAGRSVEASAREFFADDPEPVRGCAFSYLGLEPGPAVPEQAEREVATV